MKRQTKSNIKDRIIHFAAAHLPWMLLVIALALLPCSSNLRGQAKAPAKGKWVTLFDGKSMANWNPTGDANWRLMDGAAVADKGMGYLVSQGLLHRFRGSRRILGEQ
jgi:hypothetical protein